MKSKLIAITGLVMVLFSCQKEIGFDSPQDNNPNTGNPNGDLLVKAIQITLNANNDTNYVGVKWNAAKRLIEYTTNGVVNGFPTKVTHKIERGSDNKITGIVSSTELQNTVLDSVIFQVYYKPNSNQLSHVTGLQHTFIGEIRDSMVYVYNNDGKVISKEVFVDFWGSMDPTSKETYEWDANGNCTKINKFEFDGVNYSPAGGSTITYDTHKAMVTLGEEAYILFDPTSLSVNNIAQIVMNSPTSGTSTLSFSNGQFNSFDRPTELFASVTPVPPGYQQKLLMFYE